MAREKDEGKRQAILGAAKRLFAAQGFNGTSISDLARETGLPVGSIYTYFENKDALARAVIEEGWELFFSTLSSALAAESPERGLSLIVRRFLPELFRDVDLIALIVSEGWRLNGGYESVGLAQKLDRLAALVGRLVTALAAERGLRFDFPPRRAMAALSLYFLGALDSIRLSRSASLGFSEEDILDFIELSIESAFGLPLRLSLPAEDGPQASAAAR
ncbi:MAG TPA: TetR/AcrR family transcriptional regulator [Rectinemataceae bacterium]|nr:TetR/AcrR family transcriptional regulator [Rectinemataceae bacterium]